MKTLLEKTEERWSNNKINILQAANILVGYTGGIINCVKTRDLLCRTREIRLALEKAAEKREIVLKQEQRHHFIVFYLYSSYIEIDCGKYVEKFGVSNIHYECENDIPKESELMEAISHSIKNYGDDREIKGITGITELTKSSYEYYESK